MLLITILVIYSPIITSSYEYCKPEIQKKLCGKHSHTICDPKNAFGQDGEVSSEGAIEILSIANYSIDMYYF